MKQGMIGLGNAAERELLAAGYRIVAGLDEAGMGPWAGPLVAAAVILPLYCDLPMVDDSKKMTERRREMAAVAIMEQAVAWAVGEATAAEVDEFNPRGAGALAMRRAVAALPVAPDFLLVDGFLVRDCDLPQRSVVGGDGIVLSIAAASVLAKTHRDALMLELDAQYPAYGFSKHKGYGTALHAAALAAHGPCPVHRFSYAPVKQHMK